MTIVREGGFDDAKFNVNVEVEGEEYHHIEITAVCE